MNQLMDLIRDFKIQENWKSYVRENFERKSGAYNFVSVTRLKIKYNNRVYDFPVKIVFEEGWLSTEKHSRKTERFLVGSEWVTIIETKTLIPFRSFERGEKFSGELDEILSDLVGNNNFVSTISGDLLQTADNPLYGIDSLQQWPSYVMVLQKNKVSSGTPVDAPDIWTDVLKDYGIHYAFDPSLRHTIIVTFPIRYIRIVENKINRREKESILLVLEFNNLTLFYTSRLLIEVQAVIKNTKNQVVYEQTRPIQFEKTRFQVVELTPEEPSEIAFAAVSILINNILVNKSSGYYIRDIKLDLKIG